MGNRARDLLLLGLLAFLALGARPQSESRILLLVNGSSKFLGIIATTGASTPADNVSTASPFNIPAGAVLVLNCSIATKYAQLSAAAFTTQTDAKTVDVTGVTTTTAPFITNDQLAGPGAGLAYLAVDSTVGVTTCIVAQKT